MNAATKRYFLNLEFAAEEGSNQEQPNPFSQMISVISKIWRHKYS
jgi:hypothetical protein